MDIKTIVNSIGITLTIIGVYVVFVKSPINKFKIDGGTCDTDFNKIEKNTDKKNLWLKIGVYIIILGSFLQLISNFMK